MDSVLQTRVLFVVLLVPTLLLLPDRVTSLRLRVLITIYIYETLSLRRAQPSSYFPSCPLYIYIDVYEIVSRWPCEFSLDPLSIGDSILEEKPKIERDIQVN